MPAPRRYSATGRGAWRPGVSTRCSWPWPTSTVPTTSSGWRRSPPDLLELGAGQPEHAPGHDQLLDLLGALEDVEDLGVTRPLLEQLALGVPDRARELHARQRDVGADPARLRLGHRGLEGVRPAVVRHPRRL